MAYTRNKILLYGAIGIVMASLLIILFMPVQEETSVYPVVGLQEIPGYGFQIVKISEQFSELTSLNITLHDFEIRRSDGSWESIEISGGLVSFNLLEAREKSFSALINGLETGSYDAIRFSFVRGLQSVNATLDNGDVVNVDVPENKVELTTSPSLIENSMGNLTIILQKKSGVLSNYIGSNYHVSLSTLKIEITFS